MRREDHSIFYFFHFLGFERSIREAHGELIWIHHQ